MQQKKPPKKPHGNQKMTDKLFFEVCDIISETSLSITAACKKKGIGQRTFYLHLRKAIELNRNEIQAYYARAREAQADLLFNKMINTAIKATLMKKTITHGKGGGETNIKEYLTHEGIAANKLLIDTLKFAVAKLNPRKYSDVFNLNTNENKLSHEDLLKRLNGD